MDTLLNLHSGLRWLIVLIGVLALVRLAVGLVARQPYDRAASVLMRLLVISVDIQILVGLIYFIWDGLDHDLWPRERFEHLAAMLVASFFIHLPMRWRQAPVPVRYRNDLLALVAALVIIFVGVVALPGGTANWQP